MGVKSARSPWEKNTVEDLSEQRVEEDKKIHFHLGMERVLSL
jgi:hypothetical protein